MTKLSENAENYLNNRFSALKDRRKKGAEEKKMQQKKRMQQIIREINEHANYEDEKCETFLQRQQELKEVFQNSPKNIAKQQRILTDITNVFSEICIAYPEISEQFFGGNEAEDIAGSIEMLLCGTGPINDLLQSLGADFIEEMRQSLLVSSPEPSANMPEQQRIITENLQTRARRNFPQPRSRALTDDEKAQQKQLRRAAAYHL